MSTRKNRLPQQALDIGDVVPDDNHEHDDRAPPSKPAARTAGGRFAPGHCPNPKGRPRKQPEAGDDLVTRILNEPIPTGSAGRGPTMTVREALVRSICVRGYKDPAVALAMLRYDASCRQAARVDAAPEAPEIARAALQSFVERENRRKAVANGVAGSSEDDGGLEA